MAGAPGGKGLSQSIDSLIQKVRSYNGKGDTRLIREAYDFARIHHADQYRRSGEEFILHPLGVAHILADMQMDETTLAAALLHDVGKIGIEDAILTKPEQLTDAEFAKMRAHTIKGAAIVSSIKLLRDVIPGIRSHHENWAGGGYPDGLVGEAIPLVARIIAAADVFDAMTTTRPYQKALSLDFVLNRMRDLAGTKLDPRVVEAFFSALRAGDLVPLGEVEVA